MSDVDTMAGYLITALGMIRMKAKSYRLMSIILRWFLKKWKVLESLKSVSFFMIRKKQKRNLKKNEDTSEKNSKMTSQEDNWKLGYERRVA